MSSSDPLDISLVPKGLLELNFSALAQEFNTPLFIYDEDELRRRCREYTANFPTVVYAGKAFLCKAMVQLIAEEGLSLDCATGGELHVALTAGMPASRIVFHGNNKSLVELSMAVDAGVGHVVVDSFDEIERLGAIAVEQKKVVPVLVRVTPGVEAHTHEFIETGTEISKFGFTISEGVAINALNRVHENPSLDLRGVHCHIGSQIYRLDAFSRAIDRLAELALAARNQYGIIFSILNLGGGLGARYLSEDPQISITAYSQVLHDSVATAWGASDLGDIPAIMVEPGRSIAAPSAITLYRVGTIKEIPGVGTYVAVDGGMSDNPRPVLYGSGYEAYLPERVHENRPFACSVVGKHCEQGDIIVADAQLPAEVQPGDLLATPTTGAYGYSMASNYNMVPRPAVLFASNGEVRCVLRRETPEDLTRLDG